MESISPRCPHRGRADEARAHLPLLWDKKLWRFPYRQDLAAFPSVPGPWLADGKANRLNNPRGEAFNPAAGDATSCSGAGTRGRPQTRGDKRHRAASVAEGDPGQRQRRGAGRGERKIQKKKKKKWKSARGKGLPDTFPAPSCAAGPLNWPSMAQEMLQPLVLAKTPG